MTRVSALIFAVWVLNAGLAHAVTTYTVKKGDTLTQISREFALPLSKIKQANKMRSNALAEGRRLVIPDCAMERKHTAEEPARSVPAPRHASAQHTNTYHTVKKGDTLGKIARRYSLTEDDLRTMNNLPADRIAVGQRLLVKVDEPTSYTVKKGDSLAKVAGKVRVNAAEIREINGLRSDVLKPGQTLRLARTKQDRDVERDHPTELVADERPAAHAVFPVKADGASDMPGSQDILQLDLRDRLLLFAKKMLDLPYRFGGNSTFGIDCSAFVQRTFGAVGITLPRSAREQFEVGTEIDKDDLSAGDLVFFRTYASFPSHVGIYLGNNFFIHASSKSKKVTIDSLDTPYYVRRFIGARRLVGDDNNLAGFVE